MSETRVRTPLSLATLLGLVASLGLLASGAARAAPYGVIELGAKGDKSYIFDVDRAAHDPSCAEEGEAYLKCINPQTLTQVNCNTITDPDFKCTIGAINDFIAAFTTKYQIPADHIYLVGSSSVGGKELQRDILIGQINDKVHPAHPIEFVSVEQEATYNLKGVLGMLPDKIRPLRSQQAVIIDIGSGNTKGAYQSMAGGTSSVVFFGVDTGTKVAADAINKLRTTEDFAPTADKWRTTVLLPKLRTEIENKNGISNRNRVYLTGGISWALENLSDPDNVARFPRIEPRTIDTMLAKAQAADAGSVFCSPQQRSKYSEINNICDTFSADQLVAGFEILKGLSDELKFGPGKKSVFFFRDALYAWPLGYIRDKLHRDEAGDAAAPKRPQKG